MRKKIPYRREGIFDMASENLLTQLRLILSSNKVVFVLRILVFNLNEFSELMLLVKPVRS